MATHLSPDGPALRQSDRSRPGPVQAYRNSINGAGTVLDRSVVSLSLASLLIYGMATLFWVFLLQTAPLSRAYPYMALSFVIVGLASWAYFQEPLSGLYIAGLTLVVLGIVMIAAA